MKRWMTMTLLAIAASGCALEKVQPWQREYLARPEMNWDAGLVGEQAQRDHTYVSKEAATGGATIGGGGCGCN
jgi:hypothetical protein